MDGIIISVLFFLALLYGISYCWSFGHKGSYGKLVALFEVKRQSRVLPMLPAVLYIEKESGGWQHWSSFSIAYEPSGLYIGHVGIFKLLVPAVSIPWSELSNEEENFGLFSKKQVLTVRSLGVRIALPKSHKTNWKKLIKS